MDFTNTPIQHEVMPTFFCPQCKTHCNIVADGLGNDYCESCEESVPQDSPTPSSAQWGDEFTHDWEDEPTTYDLSEMS